MAYRNKTIKVKKGDYTQGMDDNYRPVTYCRPYVVESVIGPMARACFVMNHYERTNNTNHWAYILAQKIAYKLVSPLATERAA